MADINPTQEPAILNRVYRFRLRPTKEQARAMMRIAGAVRWVWNWGLHRRNEHFAKHERNIGANVLCVDLTALKRTPGHKWLDEPPASALQQSLRFLDRAFARFFDKKGGLPKFRSAKRTLPWFRLPTDIWLRDGRMRIRKVGVVRVRQTRPVQGKITSASFKRDRSGRWFVAIVTRFEPPAPPAGLPDPERTVGMDAGLRDFAVLSNGERTPCPKFSRRAERKIARARRVLCRRKEGSRRREKARLRVARLHQKAANRKADFLHKESASLVKRFNGICIEGLRLQAFARTKLAKAFADASHGEFRRQLEYKARWNGKHFVAVDTFFPSSKKCSACGAVNQSLALADKEWACGCGARHDRDINAALNIKAEGLRLLAARHADSNARGADARPPATAAVGDEPRTVGAQP